MHQVITLDQLPSFCEPLVEAAEMIIAAEILTNDLGYSCIKYDNGECTLRVGMLPTFVIIPANVSSYYPPNMKIYKKDLNKLIDKEAFGKELESINILLTKKENVRRGYTYMGSSTSYSQEEPHWQLIFTNLSKFYDFYLICDKYKLF